MPSAPITAVTYFIMGLLAAVNAQTVVANLDAPSWQAADDMSVLLFIVVLLPFTLASVDTLPDWMRLGAPQGRRSADSDVKIT